MRKIEHPDLDHFVTGDWEHQYHYVPQDVIKLMGEQRVSLLTNPPLFREAVQAWRVTSGLKRSAMLESHGIIRKNQKGEDQWVFPDGGIHIPMQQWIDENDGKYAALIVFACNPRNDRVTSAASVILHANRDFSIYSSEAYTTPLARLYVPKEGYLDEDPERLRAFVSGLKDEE